MEQDLGYTQEYLESLVTQTFDTVSDRLQIEDQILLLNIRDFSSILQQAKIGSVNKDDIVSIREYVKDMKTALKRMSKDIKIPVTQYSVEPEKTESPKKKKIRFSKVFKSDVFRWAFAARFFNREIQILIT